MKNKLIITTGLLVLATLCQAKVILPGCFTDNMVLQQKSNVNLWGKADVGKNLTIITSWNKKTYTIKPMPPATGRQRSQHLFMVAHIPSHLMMASKQN